MYDTQNIFAKILRGEVPCTKVYEDENVLAFYDINPKVPMHILVLPKGAYCSFHDFTTLAPPLEVAAFFKTAALLAEQLGIADKGYRLITNHGEDSGQEVPHFHLHLLGGNLLGL